MSPAIAAPGPQNARVFSALDEAPMTWTHYRVWLAASGGPLINGFSVVALGIALSLLERDFSITPVLIGLIGSALMLGAVAGAAMGGVAADRYGRKRVFVADMALIVVAALIGAAAPDPRFVLATQFLLGVGIGIDFPTSASYVSEIMPRSARSRMTVATIAMQSVGMVGAALVSLAILEAHPSTIDGRILLAANGAIALLYLAARTQIPESVRWLVTKGRTDEANALMRKLSVEFGEAAQSVSRRDEVPSAAAAAARSGAEVASLFGDRYRARTLLASLPWMLMDVATYGVGLFTPVILGAMHFGRAGDGPIAAVFADAEGSAFVDVFLLIGCLAGLWAIPRFGRIPMQVAGFSGMALGMLLLLFAAMAKDGAQSHLALVIGGFILFNFAMNAGPNSTTFTLAPVLFPTAIRASASGFAAATSKVGAAFGTFVTPQLEAAWGLAGVLALMAAVSVAGLVTTAALVHVIDEEGAIEE